ncbi:MAG: cysteine sulfinate desulfinase [Patescibacteria group bacterium]|nr:cysteine sulfinate desulfinase [Patescibacteria group bacterium]
MFNKKNNIIQNPIDRLPEFNYIDENSVYLDTACQSMRPQPVIDAINNYYTNYNACGGRVKYKWGQKVDAKVEETRELVLNYLSLPTKEFICSFTLNTTYGLNLILSQLPTDSYEQVTTSEIEHNSVFLTTIELAKRLKVKRNVLKRDKDGNLIYSTDEIRKAVVVVNAVSNIDGQKLNNIEQLIKDVHQAEGIVVIDAAQAMAHYHEMLKKCNADAICFSAHKMYATSLGVIIIKKDLLKSLNKSFVGGGMVTGVQKNNYQLFPDDMASWLEPGLQAYGEIISLGESIKWLTTVKPFGLKPTDYISKISKQLYDGLYEISGIKILNNIPSSVISLYHEKVDAHRLAVFLSATGIMTRSGYFCCHYYLLENLSLPPLLRFSVGLHTNENDIIKTIKTMERITKG